MDKGVGNMDDVVWDVEKYIPMEDLVPVKVTHDKVDGFQKLRVANYKLGGEVAYYKDIAYTYRKCNGAAQTAPLQPEVQYRDVLQISPHGCAPSRRRVDAVSCADGSHVADLCGSSYHHQLASPH